MRKIWKRKEIRLTENQSLLLLMSVVAITILSFTLGYISGGPDEAPDETAPPPYYVPYSVNRDIRQPNADQIEYREEANLIKESELTFYETLTSNEQDMESGEVKEVKEEEEEEEIEEKINHSSVRASKIEKEKTPGQEKGVEYTIQVGAFKREKEADRLKDRLAKKGYEPYIITYDKEGTIWYRVRVGVIFVRKDVEVLAKKIIEEENLTSFITRYKR